MSSSERREKREEITKKTARDPQMRFFEQQQLTDRVCWGLESLHFKGGSWLRRKNPSRICSRHGLALSASSGGMEESREKREERREQMAAS